MSTFSVQNLIKYISQKDKYKNSLAYIKQVELQNENVYSVINQALHTILVANNLPPTVKLFGLRFFKDLFLSAQFQLIDNLHQNIIKTLIKICQYDKDNQNKQKRGSGYFQQIQKRNKQKDLQKISFSYVLFATELIYAMGTWYTQDQNKQKTQYAEIYQKLQKNGVPFPQNDKQLKFLKPQQHETFNKNFKQWVQKLPEIQQVEQDCDQKQNLNQKSRKSIKQMKSNRQLKSKQNTQQSSSILKQTINKTDVLLSQQKPTISISLDQHNKLKQKLLIKQKQIQEIKNVNQQKQKKLKSLQKQLVQVTQQKVKQQENHKLTIQKYERQLAKFFEIQKNYKELEIKYKDIQKDIEKERSNVKVLAKQNSKFKQEQKTKQSSILQTTKKYEQLQLKYKALINHNSHPHQTTSKDPAYTLLEKKCFSLQKQNQKLILKINEIKKQNQSILLENAKKEHIMKQYYEDNQIMKKELSQQKNKIKLLENENINQFNLHANESKTNNSNSSNPVNKTQSTSQPAKQTTKCLQCPKKQTKITQLNNQIQQIAKNFTKTIIQLKQKVKSLQHQKQTIEDDKNKLNKEFQEIKLKVSKNNETDGKKSDVYNNQYKHIQIQQLIDQEEDSKTLKKSNSMSKYLEERQQQQQQLLLLKKSINHPYMTTEINQKPLSMPQQKVRMTSLGKTQKSSQKLKHRKQRYSSGKTFHFAPNQNNKNMELSSLKIEKGPSFKEKMQYNNQKNVSGYRRQSQMYNLLRRQQQNNMFQKKSSALYLNRKSHILSDKIQQFQQKYPIIQKHTLIPFIPDYFPLNSHQSSPIQKQLFQSICLNPEQRPKQPYYVNKTIQLKLIKNPNQLQNQCFTLEIMNISYNTIKIKSLICHDQFKIIGEKIRVIESNCKAEYQIETKVKDLNLRYPVVSIIVTQQTKQSYKKQNTIYNIPLPLTLLQFSQFTQQKPQFLLLNKQKLKYYESQPFQINKRKNNNSIHQYLSKLYFIKNLQGSWVRNRINQQKCSWNGTIRHKFIQNIEAYIELTVNQNKVKLLFGFRDYDQLSQNYSKVMIQVIMFLLASN